METRERFTVDINNRHLKIGDLVYFRTDHANGKFNRVGTVHAYIFGETISILTDNDGIYEKYPKNLLKMTDEEAMLWKLENS